MEHCKGSGGIATDDVIGECKLLYFAGVETTSVLLSGRCGGTVLATHPEW